MFSGIWDKMKGVGSAVASPMVNAYNNAMAPDDDLIGALAEAEAGVSMTVNKPLSPEEAEMYASGKYNGAQAAAAAGSQDQKEALDAIAADDKKKRDAMAQAGAMMANAGKGDKQTFAQHQMGLKGPGQQVQTQDQYAMAMQALVDKYGKFMFNQNF